MSEKSDLDAGKVSARVSGMSIKDQTDNDVDEGIALMRAKEQWPPEYVIEYMNKVRRGKIIKALLFALIAQIPLIIVLLSGR